MPGPDTPEFRLNWLTVGAMKGFGQERNASRSELPEASSGSCTDGQMWKGLELLDSGGPC